MIDNPHFFAKREEPFGKPNLRAEGIAIGVNMGSKHK
jgi:hypothetical protein